VIDERRQLKTMRATAATITVGAPASSRGSSKPASGRAPIVGRKSCRSIPGCSGGRRQL